MYELPFGPGKKYLNHGVASKVAGGWQISGVHRYQSGSPTVIEDYYGNSNPFSTGNYRLSLTGLPVFNKNAEHWTPQNNTGWNSACTSTNGVLSPAGSTVGPANCAAFEDPSAVSQSAGEGYAFGNLPSVVSWWRSPVYKNEDFAILKRTSITEGKDILFKLDIPNAFNRHVFGGIDGFPGDQFFGVPGGSGHGVINAPRQIQATLRFEF
jgi:hypothetical protein